MKGTISRLFFYFAEHTMRQKKGAQVSIEQMHDEGDYVNSEYTYTAFNDFFKFYLKKDFKSFQQASEKLLESKQTKKGEQVIKDQTKIRLKKEAFQDIQKTLVKEKATQKSFAKVVDLADKGLK